MSPLTKVLVILTTVLTIAFVTLMVPYIAKVEDQSNKMTELRSELATAQGLAKMTAADIEAMYSKLINDRQALQTQVTQLQSQITDLRTAKDKAETDLIARGNEMTKLMGQLSQLAAAESKNSQLLETMSNNLQDALNNNQQMKTRQVELENRIAELESERDSYRAEARFVKERLAYVTEQYNQLNGWWQQVPENVTQRITGESGDVVSVPPRPDPPIPGQVTRVDEVSGQTYVQINVGTADGVKEGMEFKVFRGEDRFLAKLTIETVDVDAAAGLMSLVQGQVQEGDNVLAE